MRYLFVFMRVVYPKTGNHFWATRNKINRRRWKPMSVDIIVTIIGSVFPPQETEKPGRDDRAFPDFDWP